MKARTILIWLLFVAASAVLVFLNLPTPGQPEHVAKEPPIPSTYEARFAEYEQLYRAIHENDYETLQTLQQSSGYVRYQAALALASSRSVPVRERMLSMEIALELRVNDTLKRAERRAMYVLYGTISEEAGATEVALSSYAEALPDPAAIAGIKRVAADPVRQAQLFSAAGLHTETLAALRNVSVPSLEAPALRALGRHEEALQAYRAWLAEQPGSEVAQLGEAWSLFSLDRITEAGEAFLALGPAGYYGLGLVENRLGNIPAATKYLIRSGTAANHWLATTLLERAGNIDEAIAEYLVLGAGTSQYADDAAFRAYVLADRANNAFLAQEALELLPPDNFFMQRLGNAHYPVTDATVGEEPLPELNIVELAVALTARGYTDAAHGELLFALRDAEQTGDVYVIGALAQALQAVGEYRMSAQAAYRLVQQQPEELRWWELAYPEAWPEAVHAAAAEFGVDPSLVWAVMRQESAYSPVAVSVSNAQGLMQIVPSTWDWLAELLGVAPGEPFHPETNITYGTKYLGWLLNYFDGDEELAIASYNGGQGYVGRLLASDLVGGDKLELFRHFDRIETREYLARVTEHQAVYEHLYGD